MCNNKIKINSQTSDWVNYGISIAHIKVHGL